MDKKSATQHRLMPEGFESRYLSVASEFPESSFHELR